MSTDLTFLTNEADRKFAVRLHNLLPRCDSFDCLVGYFYLSGFHLIQESLEPCGKIRILIGLETEQQVHDALLQAQQTLNLRSTSDTTNHFNNVMLHQLETAEESQAVESGIEKLVRWCSEGKVEIRAYDKSKIHAKLYIFSFAQEQLDKGRVITGSSNLSQSGLQDNLEFNVELKNRSDYDFALQKFEELWKDSVEVSQDFVSAVEEKSHLAQFSPRELYLTLLYEYFQNELTQIRELDSYIALKSSFGFNISTTRFLTAKRILEELNGVFIADVVGLGKTYMAAMLARELDGGILVYCRPPDRRKKSRSMGKCFSRFRSQAIQNIFGWTIGRDP
ncbi:MAG: NgoFVII family restriction endonuclease [Chloracidobacterium sp.]|nr:NgoFVII family restriction endonuclease [Chloracidobacterium sp.]